MGWVREAEAGINPVRDPEAGALVFGLKAAVLAIGLQAVVRVGRRALRNGAMRAIAALSFLAIFAFGAPFPLIVLAAGLAGFLGAKAGIAAFAPGGGHGAAGGAPVADAGTLLGADSALLPAAARRGALVAGAVALALWLLPVAILVLALGPGNVFADIAVFFSKMAVVTFGGAYAVLAYVAQEAVGTYGWLQPGEMVMDQHALGRGDRPFHRLKLQRDLGAGAPGLDHADDVLQVPSARFRRFTRSGWLAWIGVSVMGRSYPPGGIA